MAFSETISYSTALSFSFDSTLVEVSGSVIRLKDLGGATYSTANPTVTTQHRNMVSSLSTFSESASYAGSDLVKYVLTINDVDYWWSAILTSWTTSSGTYAESNLASEINTHASTLFSDLSSLVAPVYMRVKVFLHSASGGTRPSLTSNTFTYGFLNLTPAAIAECVISASLYDLLGNAPTYSAAKPTTLYVACDRAFFHGSRFVVPFTKAVDFDSTGAASISIIETTTPGVKLNFSLSYFDGNSRKFTKLFNALVPNTAASTLNNISVTRYVDYG